MQQDDKYNVTQTDFTDTLKVEGVNCKGFGVLPKYVMLDLDLTIEAKAIYAYFCSFAGNGSTSFPGRDRILADLGMCKDAYYRHFRLLTGYGYITVQQDQTTGIKGRNIYTLISNPKKFQDKPGDSKQQLAYSRIRMSGLKAAGYGMMPKLVMIDQRLPVKAKGIYAYFCTFTGSGNNAFPKKNTILYHLGITDQTYYKYYKLLTDLNYIVAVQRHINGRLSINDYYLIDTPDESQATPKMVLAIGYDQNPKKQDTVKQDTVKQDITIQDTVKQDTNSNNIIKNNPNIITHSLTEPESEKKDRVKEYSDSDIIIKELLKAKKIPEAYKTDDERMKLAIRFMADWDTYYPHGYGDEFKQRVYNLFVNALVEMCITPQSIVLKGNRITSDKVVERLNMLANFNESYIDITEFSEPAIQNYTEAVTDKHIKNPMQYMKACIWDAMLTGQVTLYASLKRNGY